MTNKQKFDWNFVKTATEYPGCIFSYLNMITVDPNLPPCPDCGKREVIAVTSGPEIESEILVAGCLKCGEIWRPTKESNNETL